MHPPYYVFLLLLECCYQAASYWEYPTTSSDGMA
jgi:hypothetical protein